MSNDRRSESPDRQVEGNSPVSPEQIQEDTPRQSTRRLDAAEDELKHNLTEAKEKTEEAGHRLAGPLDE